MMFEGLKKGKSFLTDASHVFLDDALMAAKLACEAPKC